MESEKHHRNEKVKVAFGWIYRGAVGLPTLLSCHARNARRSNLPRWGKERKQHCVEDRVR